MRFIRHFKVNITLDIKKIIMKKILPFLLFFMMALSHNNMAQVADTFLLNENFDRNKMGWIEEFTDAHYTGIKEGFLYIVSKDTSKLQTSNGPQNISFLWDVPNAYEITAAIYPLQLNAGASYGIIISSSTLTYKFCYTADALAELTENDYNKEEAIYVFSKKHTDIIKVTTDAVIFKIKITERKFIFYLNDKKISEGEFNAKAWDGIRLFVTSGSSIKADYLKIKKD